MTWGQSKSLTLGARSSSGDNSQTLSACARTTCLDVCARAPPAKDVIDVQIVVAKLDTERTVRRSLALGFEQKTTPWNAGITSPPVV